LELTKGHAKIVHLVGRHGKATVSMSGDASIERGRQTLDLKLDATGLELDGALRKALPRTARGKWDLLKPSGVADVAMTLKTSIGQPAATGTAIHGTDYHLTIRPRNVSTLYKHFPYPLTNVSGLVTVVPGRMTLKGVRGLAGRATVALDGEVVDTPAGERGSLVVHTAPVRIDERLLAAMPVGLVEMLRLQPGGTAKLDLKQLVIRRDAPPATQPTTRPAGAAATGTNIAWSWDGVITLRDAVMDLGFGGREITGKIEGAMGSEGPAEALYARAKIDLDRIVVNGRRLLNVTGALNKLARSPTLRVDDLSGRVDRDGRRVRSDEQRVAGFAEYRFAKSPRYGVRVSVSKVSLNEFLNAGVKDPAKRHDIRGMLTGTLQMVAAPGDRASRRATGKLHISDARIVRLPVMMGLLHVVYLSLPSDSAFHTADMEYTLRGDEMIFREIHLQGSAMSMLGAGRMNMKTKKLRLTFLTGPPHKLPRLVGLTEFLEGVSTGLMTVHVTGTLDKPKTRTEPLGRVDKALREIFNPEQK